MEYIFNQSTERSYTNALAIEQNEETKDISKMNGQRISTGEQELL